MEDGCSKRFDIETVDFRPQNYSTGDQNTMSVIASSDQPRQASYSSTAHYGPLPGITTSQGAHENSLTSATGSFLERQEYMAADSHAEPVWPG
jgi:hypothetical protein